MERPDGSQPTAIGWVLVAAGVIATFVGVNAETNYGLIWGVVIANLGIGLGIILISLGYLAKAIWFLPGRQPEEPNTAVKARASAPSGPACEDCQWCGLTVYGPAQPCSHQSDEQLRQELGLMTDEVIHHACRTELISRGYLEA